MNGSSLGGLAVESDVDLRQDWPNDRSATFWETILLSIENLLRDHATLVALEPDEIAEHLLELFGSTSPAGGER